MRPARRHHFLPQHYQRRFTRSDGSLWILDKRRRGLFQTSPANAFVETHLYATTDAAGERSDQVERALSIMEGIVEPIIDYVVANVRQMFRPHLSVNDREWLLAFFEVQYKRTPQTLQKISSSANLNRILESAIEEYESENGPVPPQVRASALDSRHVARIAQNTLMRSLLRFDGLAHDAIQTRGIAFAKSSVPSTQFILGSRPFARFSSQQRRVDLGDPGSELWMPLAPDVALASHGVAPNTELMLIDIAGVRKINEEIFRDSDVVASSSRALLEALAKRFGIRALTR